MALKHTPPAPAPPTTLYNELDSMAAGLDQVQPGSVQRIRSLAVALFSQGERTEETKRRRRQFVGSKTHGEMSAAAQASETGCLENTETNKSAGE